MLYRKFTSVDVLMQWVNVAHNLILYISYAFSRLQATSQKPKTPISTLLVHSMNHKHDDIIPTLRKWLLVGFTFRTPISEGSSAHHRAAMAPNLCFYLTPFIHLKSTMNPWYILYKQNDNRFAVFFSSPLEKKIRKLWLSECHHQNLFFIKHAFIEQKY